MTTLRKLRKPFGAILAVTFAQAVAPRPVAASDWLQWGRTPQHRGVSPVRGQRPERILDSLVYDPFVVQMRVDSGFDSLLAHYSVPLISDGAVYMVFKSGAYTGVGSYDSIDWSVKKLEWIGGQLEAVWTFETDWKPEPLSFTGWESVLLPAISGHDVYVPGLGGTVHRVATETGISEGRINPFTNVDPTRYVAGGLGVAPDGSIVYNVIDLPTSEEADVEGAWLVKVGHESDEPSRVSYSTLVPGGAVGVGAVPDAVRDRPAPVAADAHRRAADGGLRLSAPRDQRRSRDRGGRHHLYRQPGAPLRPLRLPRGRAFRSHARVGGVVPRDPERRLRRPDPDRRYEPRLPHGGGGRSRSRHERPARGPRPRRRDVLARRPSGRQRPHRDARRATTSPAAISSSSARRATPSRPMTSAGTSRRPSSSTTARIRS